MRNPYKRNILLQLTLIGISTLGLNYSFKYLIKDDHLYSIIENIIIGLFSSAVLLFLIEILQMISDKRRYGYLEGIYKRTIITDVIANSDIVKGEKRTEELSDEQKKRFEAIGLIPIPGSRYVEVKRYHEIGKNWQINLKYLYHGIYEGIAEYHKYWENNGNSTMVKFTMTLNPSNLTAGNGNYKYIERDDYGEYKFQVNENDDTEILVEYKNVIPNGLSEGYEKWKRAL